MRIEEIDIALIEIPAGRRVINPVWAEALAEDFTKVGQKTPIDVIELKEPFSKDAPKYRLVAGGHRVAAKRICKAASIEARIFEPSEFASEAQIKLSEIAENFMRRELTVLDRAYDVAAWREIYEAATGVIRPGKKVISRKLATNSDEDLEALGEQFSGTFSEASRKALRLSKDAVFRALKIASLSQVVRERISLHAIADNQSELLALAAETEARRDLIVALLTAEPPKAMTVAQAVGIIDKVPAVAPAQPWERLSGQFTRLTRDAQRRFLEENWDLVEQLYVERMTKTAA